LLTFRPRSRFHLRVRSTPRAKDRSGFAKLNGRCIGPLRRALHEATPWNGPLPLLVSPTQVRRGFDVCPGVNKFTPGQTCLPRSRSGSAFNVAGLGGCRGHVLKYFSKVWSPNEVTMVEATHCCQPAIPSRLTGRIDPGA